jgi:hypothetical protein
MSDGSNGPPPGAVHEPAERAVDFVRRALGIGLDYTAETLPVLDHYLSTVPRDRPEMIDLVASCAGAYFGEVVRKVIGGEWEIPHDNNPMGFRMVIVGGVGFSPVALARAAILHAEGEEE